MIPLSTLDKLAAHERVIAALEAFCQQHGTCTARWMLQCDALKPTDGDVGREAQYLLGTLIGRIKSQEDSDPEA
ncbi:hypothetical protein [Brevundimonas mediterranea]|uniref:hypothetical protein n=1 Tax=Brevundimonas mediterranea TaxID=74329 RepID=UPI0011FBC35F|nr:MAG: hypothetical protein EPO54_08605 [Brevundimonas sp.]